MTDTDPEPDSTDIETDTDTRKRHRQHVRRHTRRDAARQLARGKHRQDGHHAGARPARAGRRGQRRLYETEGDPAAEQRREDPRRGPAARSRTARVRGRDARPRARRLLTDVYRAGDPRARRSGRAARPRPGGVETHSRPIATGCSSRAAAGTMSAASSTSRTPTSPTSSMRACCWLRPTRSPQMSTTSSPPPTGSATDSPASSSTTFPTRPTTGSRRTSSPSSRGAGFRSTGCSLSERELSGVTIAELADELGASVLVDNGQDGYVERFTVGAMGSDSALRHFRRTRDAAVITGGDRAEIHTAALEGPRRPLSHPYRRPPAPSAIVGQASEKGVPILAVQTDTLTTVERAEGRRPQRPDSRCRHRRPDATAAVRSRRRRLDSGIGSSVGGFGITLVSTDSCRFGSATPVSADLATDSTGRNCRCTGRNCRCTGRNCRCTGRPGRVRCDDYRV